MWLRFAMVTGAVKPRKVAPFNATTEGLSLHHDITVTQGECDAEGRRTVTLDAVVAWASASDALYWDFGDHSGFSRPFGPTGSARVDHVYSGTGPYTAQLTVFTPPDRPPAIVVVGPLDPCPTECPTVNMVRRRRANATPREGARLRLTLLSLGRVRQTRCTGILGITRVLVVPLDRRAQLG